MDPGAEIGCEQDSALEESSWHSRHSSSLSPYLLFTNMDMDQSANGAQIIG